MTRPSATSPVRRAVRPALVGAVLVAVLAGCTSTPAAPGQSSAGPAASTISGTASAGVTTGPSSAPGTESGSSPTSATADATTPAGSATVTTDSPSASTDTAGSPTSSEEGGTSAVPTVPSSSVPPAATTTVPAPGGGNINQTVPSVAETTAPSRQLTQTAEFGGRVTAQIVSLKAITGEANGPGEIAGPALSITLRVTNGSSAAIVLDGVGVTLTDSSGAPTSTLAGPPSSPFTGTLAAGASASGTYVFTIATDKRRPITLALSYSTEAPTVVFAGNAP